MDRTKVPMLMTLRQGYTHDTVKTANVKAEILISYL